MRLSTARLRFPCLRSARLRLPGSRCVPLLCYCTCLYCSNLVCFSLVLLYLLVLSCTCMPMLISDIPSSIPMGIFTLHVCGILYGISKPNKASVEASGLDGVAAWLSKSATVSS